MQEEGEGGKGYIPVVLQLSVDGVEGGAYVFLGEGGEVELVVEGELGENAAKHPDSVLCIIYQRTK